MERSHEGPCVRQGVVAGGTSTSQLIRFSDAHEAVPSSITLEKGWGALHDACPGDTVYVADVMFGMGHFGPSAYPTEAEAQQAHDADYHPDRAIRLSFTFGGVVALWCRKHNLPASRAQIEELAAVLGVNYETVLSRKGEKDGRPTQRGEQSTVPGEPQVPDLFGGS